MKISIWQQFSSNHSNGFTVVGKFAIEEDAIKAEKELSQLLEDIYLQGIGYADKEPLQAELDAGKKYGFEWTQHLDWPIGADSVAQFDSNVMVSDITGNTWLGALYIDKIMAKLSNEVYVEEEMGLQGILVEMTAKLQDAQKVKKVFQKLKDYFDEVCNERGHLHKPPWRELSEELFQPFDEFHTSDDAYHGRVALTSVTLRFTHLTFALIGFGLPALIAFLKREGFTEITYTLQEAPYSEIYEEDN